MDAGTVLIWLVVILVVGATVLLNVPMSSPPINSGSSKKGKRLFYIAGGIFLAGALGFAMKVYSPVYEVKKKLQEIARFPDSVQVDGYERKNGVICGRWSASNPLGERVSTRFVYTELVGILHIEPQMMLRPEDELRQKMFLSRWKDCEGR